MGGRSDSGGGVTRGASVVVHAGDFGLWPGPTGSLYLRHVGRACAEHGVSVLVVPGNHEDWGRLKNLWANPERRGPDGQPRPVNVSEHVAFVPRPWRWEIGGRTFVALGGAASLDRHHRTEGQSWWAQELTTPEQVAAAAAGGPADALVTHEAPHDERCQTLGVRETLSTNPFDWPDQALRNSELSRRRIQQAANAIQPRLWVHGHMHAPGTQTASTTEWGHETTVWSLGADRQSGNLRFLELTKLAEAPEPSQH